MIRAAVVGLGKMGLSHLAILNSHPTVEVTAICDKASYGLGILRKNTDYPVYTDLDNMLRDIEVDALLIATPSQFHASMVQSAVQQRLHVFCEKPFCLSPEEGQALVKLSAEHSLVTQVGYHNRFIASFREMKMLLAAGAIGDVTHVLAEAYGPVVLRPSGHTWRSKRSEGGGCLYDYAAHVIDLVHWYLGEPINVSGTVLNKIHSTSAEDAVYSTLHFPGDTTAQISVNWSDGSYRKMTTRITAWGTQGKIYADRQECQVYLQDPAAAPDGYNVGWNVRYTTDLTPPPWFYLRGEEYSAQIDHFVQRILSGETDGENSFASGYLTDKIIAELVQDAQGAHGPARLDSMPTERRSGLFRRGRRAQ